MSIARIYITLSFITLILFVNDNITMYSKVDGKKLENSIIIALFSIFFPLVWYSIYKSIKNKNKKED